RVNELTNLHDELRMTLTEREATQERLVQAEKLSALGRLTGSMAHEVNNPLQAMQGCLELLDEELAGDHREDRLKKYLGTAKNETTHIARIMRRLTDSYRPVPRGTVRVSVGEVIDSALALVRDQLRQRSVSVVCDYCAEERSVRANLDQLRQVFLNLVLNAAEAMPRGGVLHIGTYADVLETGPVDMAKQAVRIDFKDEGLGMGPEVLAHLFEPFFTTKQNGAGLGLSISYGIIQAHGGQITAEGELGVGSIFSVWLPATDTEG
ncbi:MAG: ATP-binding protein, partial [Anaerolineae bacterium]|nr:ATP-binding protein [Anaerolineae bacterium]